MVPSDTLDDVWLIQFARGDSLLDHPPFLVEILLGKLVLAYVLQKLEEVYLQNLIIYGSDLNVLFLACVLCVFFIHN